MKKESAGILMYRKRDRIVEVLLVHPGGPFWRNKDLQAWTIPKGEIEPGEDPLVAAQREFAEELGLTATGPFLPLGQVRQKAGKVVHAWAFCGDFDSSQFRSNTTSIEWPPRSGQRMEIPEIDRAEFFSLEEATRRINPSQVEFLKRMGEAV